MASQLVTIFAIGGRLADEIEADLTRWYEARTTNDPREWAPEQWPGSIRAEIDTFIERLLKHGYTPPVLYRSQHVDLGSMGIEFTTVLGEPNYQFLTQRFELYAKRFVPSDKIDLDQLSDAPEDFQWLSRRVHEAATAWHGISAQRTILIIREVFGAIWDESEVAEAVDEMPRWWHPSRSDSDTTKRISQQYFDGRLTLQDAVSQILLQVKPGNEDQVLPGLPDEFRRAIFQMDILKDYRVVSSSNPEHVQIISAESIHLAQTWLASWRSHTYPGH